MKKYINQLTKAYVLMFSSYMQNSESIMNQIAMDKLDSEYSINSHLFYINKQARKWNAKQIDNNPTSKNNYYLWYEQIVRDVALNKTLSYLVAIKQKHLPIDLDDIKYDTSLSILEILNLRPVLIYEEEKNLHAIYILEKGEIFITSFRKQEIESYKLVKGKRQRYQTTSYQLFSIKKSHTKDVKTLISYLKKGRIGSNIPNVLIDMMGNSSLVIPITEGHKMYIFTVYSPHKYGKCNDIVKEYENNMANLFIIIIDANKNITYIGHSSSCCLIEKS